jgi:hypothetical protein
LPFLRRLKPAATRFIIWCRLKPETTKLIMTPFEMRVYINIVFSDQEIASALITRKRRVKGFKDFRVQVLRSV